LQKFVGEKKAAGKFFGKIFSHTRHTITQTHTTMEQVQDKLRVKTTLLRHHSAVVDALQLYPELSRRAYSVTKMQVLLRRGVQQKVIQDCEMTEPSPHRGHIKAALNLAKSGSFQARWPYAFSECRFYSAAAQFILDTRNAAVASALRGMDRVCEIPDMSKAVLQYMCSTAWPLISEHVTLGLIIIFICQKAEAAGKPRRNPKPVKKKTTAASRMIIPSCLMNSSNEKTKKRTLPPRYTCTYVWTDASQRCRNRRCGHNHLAEDSTCHCRLLLLKINSAFAELTIGHRYYSPSDLSTVLQKVAETEAGAECKDLPLYFPGCSTPVSEIALQVPILPLPLVTLVSKPGAESQPFHHNLRPVHYKSTNILGKCCHRLDNMDEMLTQAAELRAVQAAGRRQFSVQYELHTRFGETVVKTMGREVEDLVYPFSLADDLGHLMEHNRLPQMSILMKVAPSFEFSQSIVCRECQHVPAHKFLSGHVAPLEEGVHLLCRHRTETLCRKVKAITAAIEQELHEEMHAHEYAMIEAHADLLEALDWYYGAQFADDQPRSAWPSIDPTAVLYTRRALKQTVRRWLQSERPGVSGVRKVQLRASETVERALAYDIEKWKTLHHPPVKKLPHHGYPGLLTDAPDTPLFLPLVQARVDRTPVWNWKKW
jgi:hypothetical protein